MSGSGCGSFMRHNVTRMVLPRILVVIRCCSNINGEGGVEDPTQISEKAVERGATSPPEGSEDSKKSLKELARRL